MLKRKKDKRPGGTESGMTYLDSRIETDPLGMYTGNPDVPGERPVQDADDL